jgi:hypothetical protein
MNILVKWLTILAVMAVGVFFLIHGLGVDIPQIKYKGLEAHNIPVGIVIFAGGIVLTAVWKVTTTTTLTTEEDGKKTTLTKTSAALGLRDP